LVALFDHSRSFLARLGQFACRWVVIPSHLLITFIVLKITRPELLIHDLGGLRAAVGLVIDDAIVVLENIVFCTATPGQNRSQAIQARCANDVPLSDSTITPIVVFCPSSQRCYRQLLPRPCRYMTVSLFTSLLLALTWTPTLSLYLVRRKDTAGPRHQTSAGGPDVAALLAAEGTTFRFFRAQS